MWVTETGLIVTPFPSYIVIHWMFLLISYDIIQLMSPAVINKHLPSNEMSFESRSTRSSLSTDPESAPEGHSEVLTWEEFPVR